MAEPSSQQPHQLEQHQPQCGQEHMYKNRLQEFTQRANLPLPVYHTVNEGGPQHAPKFRSTVEVDGEKYTTLNTFFNRKAAEQDAAKLALEGISMKIKNCISKKTTDGGFPPIYEDRIFCKSILHEFVSKMNIEKPVYDTVRLKGLVPVYVSSLVFNGVKYTGEPSINKKEAEQLAARAVILSILANSGIGTLLSEIVKSKAKLFSAVHERTNVHTDVPPPLPNTETGPRTSETKNPEQTGNVIASIESEPPELQSSRGVSEATDQAGNVIGTGAALTLQEQLPVLLRHEFKKPMLETFPEAIPLPITFVPSLQAQSSLGGGACGEKRKVKKKKKKTSKKAKTEIQMPVSNLPLSQVSSCTVAQ